MRLHQWLQMHLNDHLRHAVSDRGNAQRPQTSTGFRDLHDTHRRWKVAARRHPIPDLVEVVLQVLLERFDRLPVHSGGAAVRLDLLVRLPHYLLGNHIRLRFWHRFLPLRVDASLWLTHSTPSLHPHYQASSLLWVDPSLGHASVLSALGGSPLHLFPWHRDPGSHVPRKSLSQAHAAFMPVTIEAVSRSRPDWSQANDCTWFW